MTGTQTPNKTIILCFDGTSNQYGSHNSNIAKLYSMLSKKEPDRQVTYYQAGIGQYYPPGSIYQLIEPLAQITDWAVGWSLSQHVIGGYRFLVQNWREGDRVLIFGFSRGAYIARCVAGMVEKVGLLVRDNDDTLVAAYRLYQRTDKAGVTLAETFKETFSHDVSIDFVGVFDTVAAVGLLPLPALPFSSRNEKIQTFRHALSLDECRSRFNPSQYSPVPPRPGITWNSKTFGLVTFLIPRVLVSIISAVLYFLTYPGEFLTWATGPSKKENKLFAKVDFQDVKEVWFAGCHADVGGSAVLNGKRSTLANITLRWMVGEIIAKDDLKIPVLWARGALEGLFESRFDPQVRPPDARDALSAIHDELRVFPSLLTWLVLELVPDFRLYDTLNHDGAWLCQSGINFGRGRLVQPSRGQVTLHETVRDRMENMKYTPRAVINSGEVRYEPTKIPDSVTHS